MPKPNHTIYFIGGPARVGKSIVAGAVMRRKHLVVIPTDGIRAAIRNVLVGESHISVEKIAFKTTAEFRRPGSLKVHKIAFGRKGEKEDDLAWIGTRGLIEAYDRADKIDLLVEGIAVTPERVHALKLKNLRVKAAFVGYRTDAHAATILAYSKKNHDWVQRFIKENGGDEGIVKRWVQKDITKSAAYKKMAKKFGYGYFDVTERPFKEHVRTTANYLLGR